MIVDSSAIVAVALRQEQARSILDMMARSPISRVSAANLLETWMVIDRRGNAEAIALVEGIIERFAIVVEPITAEHVSIAREAWRRFGKGSGHRAHLNFGDCLAYALAMSLGEPLLFVGDDFTHTDL